jgi:hypothetical protein
MGGGEASLSKLLDPPIRTTAYGARQVLPKVLCMEIQTVLLPISSLVGVALGGGLQFLFGRALEARRQLTVQKSQSYVDYFKAMALVAQGGTTRDNLALAADAKVRVCIYGAPDVVDHLRRFEDVGAELDNPISQNVIVDLLRAMRRDIGRDDRGLHDEALRHILFGASRAAGNPVSGQ